MISDIQRRIDPRRYIYDTFIINQSTTDIENRQTLTGNAIWEKINGTISLGEDGFKTETSGGEDVNNLGDIYVVDTSTDNYQLFIEINNKQPFGSALYFRVKDKDNWWRVRTHMFTNIVQSSTTYYHHRWYLQYGSAPPYGEGPGYGGTYGDDGHSHRQSVTYMQRLTRPVDRRKDPRTLPLITIRFPRYDEDIVHSHDYPVNIDHPEHGSVEFQKNTTTITGMQYPYGGTHHEIRTIIDPNADGYYIKPHVHKAPAYWLGEQGWDYNKSGWHEFLGQYISPTLGSGYIWKYRNYLDSDVVINNRTNYNYRLLLEKCVNGAITTSQNLSSNYDYIYLDVDSEKIKVRRLTGYLTDIPGPKDTFLSRANSTVSHTIEDSELGEYTKVGIGSGEIPEVRGSDDKKAFIKSFSAYMDK